MFFSFFPESTKSVDTSVCLWEQYFLIQKSFQIIYSIVMFPWFELCHRPSFLPMIPKMETKKGKNIRIYIYIYISVIISFFFFNENGKNCENNLPFGANSFCENRLKKMVSIFFFFCIHKVSNMLKIFTVFVFCDWYVSGQMLIKL